VEREGKGRDREGREGREGREVLRLIASSEQGRRLSNAGTGWIVRRSRPDQSILGSDRICSPGVLLR